MLKLYHHGSSACAAKVRFALEEKNLKWEGVYLDILRGDQFSPEYKAINPKAVVPTLVHDDYIIPESTVICEYVDEVFPDHAIYPQDPYQRAKIRVWTKAVDEELHPACSAITYIASHRFTILRNGADTFEEVALEGGAVGAAARSLKWQWLQNGFAAPGAGEKIRLYEGYLRKMEAALANSHWLAGNIFSMADISMAPYVNRLSALSMSAIWRGRMPHVEAWFEKIQDRPAFTAALVKWVPDDLVAEMAENGAQAWSEVKAILNI